jgi:hypothetical protein
MKPALKRRGSRSRIQHRAVIDPSLMEVEPKISNARTSPHIKTVDSARSKKFFQLNKNRNCFENDFNQCIDNNIGVYGTPVVIGNGTFGILLRAKTYSPYGDVAIKFIFNISNESSADKFIDMEKELSFSYYMGEKDIGPKVLDSFYYNFDYGELPNFPILHQIVKLVIQHFQKKGTKYPQFLPIDKAIALGKDPANLPVEIQCIVMKAYDSDCDGVLENPSLSIETKAEIIRQMCYLMEIQIKDGLYCYDVKPGNFVVNINGKQVDVKMIDFGADFCTEKKIYKGFDNTDQVPILGINFIQLLYISNVIQIFSLVVKSRLLDNVSPSSAQKLLEAFFNHPLFSIFFSKDWQVFIDWYINYARDNIVSGRGTDPSNILVWYSKTISSGSYSILYSKNNIENTKKFLIFNLKKLLITVGPSLIFPPQLKRQQAGIYGRKSPGHKSPGHKSPGHKSPGRNSKSFSL